MTEQEIKQLIFDYISSNLRIVIDTEHDYDYGNSSSYVTANIYLKDPSGNEMHITGESASLDH